MTVTHRHGQHTFHTHSDEDYASHQAMTDELRDDTATADQDGHGPAMIEREDTPRSLAEEEAAVQDTPAATALREDQEQGYTGQDAADMTDGGTEALREKMGDAKDGPGAPEFPPGHPNDPTVPTSAGTTATPQDGGSGTA